MTPKDHVVRCRTCSGRFRCEKVVDGRWRTEFPGKPPSPACRRHRGSPLCRWEVEKARRWLWREAKPLVQHRPAAFVTLVPPRRAVPVGRLATVGVADLMRSIRRTLPKLPSGAVAIGWFDVGLHDVPAAGGGRDRHWLPHLHLVVFGLGQPATKKLIGRPYKPTGLVRRTKRVRDAPSPRNALAYSLKHADDVMADAVLVNRTGRRRVLKERWLKADERAELRRFLARHAVDDLLLLVGLRRFGRTLRRA